MYSFSSKDFILSDNNNLINIHGHTLHLISYSLIGSLGNTLSVLKMYNALHVTAETACSEIACTSVTSTDPFFHCINLLTFFMFSGILKQFYLYSFHKHQQIIFGFSVVYVTV